MDRNGHFITLLKSPSASWMRMMFFNNLLKRILHRTSPTWHRLTQYIGSPARVERPEGIIHTQNRNEIGVSSFFLMMKDHRHCRCRINPAPYGYNRHPGPKARENTFPRFCFCEKYDWEQNKWVYIPGERYYGDDAIWPKTQSLSRSACHGVIARVRSF